MSSNKYRVVPMTIEEQDGDGLAVTQVKHAADEDFLQQLIDGDE